MGQAAISISESAVKEGKRCFDAPLDHTVPNVNAHAGTREVQEPFYSLGLGSGIEGVHQQLQQSANALPGLPPSGLPVTQSSFPRSHGAAFHEGTEDAGGYFEEPLSVGDLASLEETFSNQKLEGSHSPPPPPPPPPEFSRPIAGIAGATTQQPMGLPHASPRPDAQGWALSSEGPRVVPAGGSTTQPMGLHQAPAVPEATTAALPAATSASAAVPQPQMRAAGDTQRNLWRQGSILEIYSGSTGRWYPALLLRVQKGEGTPDVLTMQFWIDPEDAKQKSLYRNDYQQLVPLGTNLEGELPPGFKLIPSQSRPGHSVFQDCTTGMKYQTAELAWQTHFQRLLERPSAPGQETVCHLPAAHSMPQQQGPAAAKQEFPEHGAEAVMAAEGLSTEYGPYLRGNGASRGPPTPQQFHGGSGTPAEQRHGAQLAAALHTGRKMPSGQQLLPHQYNTQLEATDCHRAGATRSPGAYAPGPMAVV